MKRSRVDEVQYGRLIRTCASRRTKRRRLERARAEKLQPWRFKP